MKRSCTRKTMSALTSLMLISSLLDKLTSPRRRDESRYKQHVLNQLDSLEHYLEIMRLKKLCVLRPLTELPHDCTLKHPPTRLVRPCRAKKQEEQATWLRRSRYVARDSNSRQRALRCVSVCRRYCTHRTVGGPYDRVALFILDVTDAGQRDGAQHGYL